MAVDPSAADRAYDEIRRRLLRGSFHLRQRLDAQALASDLGVSTTPVREALVRLAAERLISATRARGYHLALWSEDALRWLYAWRADLSYLAEAALAASPGELAREEGDYPTRAAQVLRSLHRGGSPECLAAARNADDRLHHARRAEAELWSDLEGEVDSLRQAIASGAPRARRAALRAYHRRRLSHVREIRERTLVLMLGPNGA